MQRRIATDGKADYSQSNNGGCGADINDNNKHSFIAGYKKIAVIIICFLVILFFRIHVIDIVSVAGTSMNDSFHQSDKLIVRKYDTESVKRYDVVVAKMGEQLVIKRVIGLPDETIHIVDGIVYVNGERIESNFDFSTEDAGVAGEPYLLGEGEYFLMGDNRSVSVDSREYGSIHLANIKGIVIMRFYPFEEIKIFDNEK